MKLLITSSLFLLFTFFQTDNYSKANKEYNNKQYSAAAETCSAALAKLIPKDPLFTKFLLIRGDCYTQLSRWQLAINDYLILSKNDPNNVNYYVNLSYLYGSTDENRKCTDVLFKAYKIDPKNINVLNNLSYYAGQIGAYDWSIRYANEGLALKADAPSRGGLLNNRGYGYLKLKKYNLALADINEAIKLDPDNSFAYCYRALVNIELKKTETVCADLNKAKSLGAVTLTADLIKQNCKN
jgi:tetratricopeptide (TPR) repeat protein